MSKSFSTVHKLDASSRENIASSVKRSCSLATRNIFPPSWQPRFNRPKKLWRHRLLGTSNGVYARVYIRLVAALLSGTGFRTSLVAKTPEVERTNRSFENFANDGWSGMFSSYKLFTYVRSSNLSLYSWLLNQLLISSSSSVSYSRFQELSTTFNFEFDEDFSMRNGKMCCLIETILVSSARGILVIHFIRSLVESGSTLFELVRGLGIVKIRWRNKRFMEIRENIFII